MKKYLLKRLLLSVFVLIGISVVIFVIARIVPGNPARLALGERASEEAIAAYSEAMHLNEPLYKQYYYWFTSALKLDLGMSLTTKRPVLTDVTEFLPATLELVIVSGLIQILFAFFLGILSAKHRDGIVDGSVRFLSYIGISVPSFAWAVIFLLIFGFVWPILPVFNRLSTGVAPPVNTITGMYITDFILQGDFLGAWDAFEHVLLPSIALAIGHIAQEARILRSSLVDNMSKEYITVTKSYGIPQNKLMYKYLLKPSAVSMITVAGMDFASTLGNAFLVETIFNWPGISRYCLTCMLNKDLNAISAVILIIGIVYMTMNIIVDLVIAALDPRVRLGD